MITGKDLNQTTDGATAPADSITDIPRNLLANERDGACAVTIARRQAVGGRVYTPIYLVKEWAGNTKRYFRFR